PVAAGLALGEGVPGGVVVGVAEAAPARRRRGGRRRRRRRGGRGLGRRRGRRIGGRGGRGLGRRRGRRQGGRRAQRDQRVRPRLVALGGVAAQRDDRRVGACGLDRVLAALLARHEGVGDEHGADEEGD